jgi:hypothetical protein
MGGSRWQPILYAVPNTPLRQIAYITFEKQSGLTGSHVHIRQIMLHISRWYDWLFADFRLICAHFTDTFSSRTPGLYATACIRPFQAHSDGEQYCGHMSNFKLFFFVILCKDHFCILFVSYSHLLYSLAVNDDIRRPICQDSSKCISEPLHPTR